MDGWSEHYEYYYRSVDVNIHPETVDTYICLGLRNYYVIMADNKPNL